MLDDENHTTYDGGLNRWRQFNRPEFWVGRFEPELAVFAFLECFDRVTFARKADDNDFVGNRLGGAVDNDDVAVGDACAYHGSA